MVCKFYNIGPSSFFIRPRSFFQSIKKVLICPHSIRIPLNLNVKINVIYIIRLD
jgi:hypothetical protein